MQRIEEWLLPMIDKYQNTPILYQINPVEGGHIVRYPVGQSLFYAPFFFIAHVLAPLFSAPQDGFSFIYQFILRLGCFLYTISGLILFRKSLLRLFDEKITSLLLVLLTFGTNLHLYAASISPHETLYFVYALMLYITTGRRQYFKISFWIKAMLLTGLACITRPTDVVICIIPILWGIESKGDIFMHLKLWFSRYIHVLLISVLVLVSVLFIQMLYWKMYAGSWISYTYETTGEKLHLASPFTVDFLFSFRKGWFIYSPIMGVAFLGFVALYFQKTKHFVSLLLFYMVNLYLISSWTSWWYADSFSSRAMVQSLTITILPLGYLIKYISEKRALFRIIFFTLIFLLFSLNLFQTWQFHKNIFPLDRLTRKAYAYIFLKTKIDVEKRESLMLINRNIDQTYIPNIQNYIKKTIAYNDYEESLGLQSPQQLCDTLSFSGKYSFRLDSTCLFSNVVSYRYYQITDKPHAWIKASCRVYMPYNFEDNYFSLVVHFQNKGENYNYKVAPLDSNSVKPQQWNYIEYLYLTPEIISKKDLLLVYLWLRNNNPIWVDDFRVDVYEPI